MWVRSLPYRSTPSSTGSPRIARGAPFKRARDGSETSVAGFDKLPGIVRQDRWPKCSEWECNRAYLAVGQHAVRKARYMTIRNLSTLFLGIAFLCGCVSPGGKTIPTVEATRIVEENQTIQPETETNPADEIIGEFDIKRALEIMYKGWTVKSTDGGELYAQQGGTDNDPAAITEYVILAVPFRQQQEDRYLVVTRYSDSQEIRALHSVEGTVFMQQKGKWILEHTGTLASYSGSATSELAQIGLERYGVLVQTQYAGTGTGVEWTVLNAYTSDGWQKLWEAQTGEAEFGKWVYSSDLLFLADAKGEYYDMQVTTTGTDGSLKQFDETKVYSINEGTYKLVSSNRHELP
jgi:hypothetical protein